MDYVKWTTTATDANGHTRQADTDAFGRTTTVREYNSGSTYTTQYQYNRLNLLTVITDTASPANVTSITYDWLGRKTAMTDPDMGSWGYRYDAVGNLIKQRDALPQAQATCTYYDPLSRPVGKTYHYNVSNIDTLSCSGTYSVTYTYDQGTNGKGRRTGMTDVSGSTSWVYDIQGRLTSQTNTINGASAYTTGWT